MDRPVAVLDANVLRSYPLTSLLLELAEARLFQPKWTARIHEEWMRALREARPDLDDGRIHRRRAAMDEAMPDAVVRRYEGLISKLQLPDPDDRHVLAAAIRSKATVIVTFNLRDFPKTAVEPYGVAAVGPDDFAAALIRNEPDLADMAFRRMLSGWRHPSVTTAEFVTLLDRVGLRETAKLLATT